MVVIKKGTWDKMARGHFGSSAESSRPAPPSELLGEARSGAYSFAAIISYTPHRPRPYFSPIYWVQVFREGVSVNFASSPVGCMVL